MAIDDILFDIDFLLTTDPTVGGSTLFIDFPDAVWLFIPYHGYITKSRLIGGV